MPRCVDYSKTIIYKLCCKDTNIKDIYVGATTCMKSRKTQHKTSCNNVKSRYYNNKLYTCIRDNGGWENWDMIMVEKYPCNDKIESSTKEREILEQLGATLNAINPIKLKEDSEKLKDYRKKYYEENKDKVRELHKKYSENNKEKIAERYKKWCENNKEKIREQSKKYREENKEKILEYNKQPYTCITCNTTMRKDTKSKHNKTKKHINNLNK